MIMTMISSLSFSLSLSVSLCMYIYIYIYSDNDNNDSRGLLQLARRHVRRRLGAGGRGIRPVLLYVGGHAERPHPQKSDLINRV